MKEIRRIIQRIKEGRLQQLFDELLWISVYVRRYWFLIGIYIALSASTSVLSLGSTVTTRNLVDSVTGSGVADILKSAGLYAGIGVVQLFLNAIHSRMSMKVQMKVRNEIRADVYEQVLRTSWASLAKYRSGDLLYRVNADAGMVASNILTFLPTVVTTLISFGGALFLVIREDPWMAVIALMGAPISLIASRYSAKRMREYHRKNQDVASNRTVFDQETFQNLQFIKAFGMVDQITEKFRAIQKESLDVAMEQNKFQQYMSITTGLVGQLIGYASYGFAVFRLWQGEISYGTMTMFVAMAASLRGSFTGLLNLAPSLIRMGISAERIMEITSLPRDSMKDKKEAENIKRIGKETGIYIHMQDVDFAYEQENWIYQNGNLQAEPGEIIALIGPSGQGKTTTLNLLLGLYHPQNGKIFIGNPGGKELTVSSSTRCVFSYIPQGNTLFSGTIADNMRMVKPDATDEEIRSVLEAACAWEFVEKLEEGINTQVRERGTRFSEGQKQRLSIARALLADAPVMILDEATSALDVATERRVLRRIIRKEPHRTVIVAAHRPSVFSMCSRVYQIGEGQIRQVNEEEIQKFLEEF